MAEKKTGLSHILYRIMETLRITVSRGARMVNKSYERRGRREKRREGLGYIAVHENLYPPGGHARGDLIHCADQCRSYNDSKLMNCV